MSRDQDTQPLIRLSLSVTRDELPRFCLLFGGGFTVLARTGCSIRDLLCGQLDVPADYLEKGIQTVFLNGRVVDDPAVATVPDGATIALSAAMPGVAGAMFRKRSPYASMRSPISHPNRPSDRQADRQGRLVIKLFNMVRDELGPTLLRRGIQIPGKALTDLFRGRSNAFRPGILAARIDDAPVSPDLLFETDWTDQELLLQVSS
jgi:hypothetical protein